MFDHQQRIAGVAQPPHDLENATDVSRVKADRRFVEHEQGIDQRGAEGGRQVDALHLAARQRPGLPVEGQVAQSDLAQVAEARTDLAEQQFGRFVEGWRQFEVTDELRDALDRHRHQLVYGQLRPGAEPPGQCLGPEAGARAGRTLGVAAIA